MLNKNTEKLQKVIEYQFNNLEVLITALTHKSYASDSGTKQCNERMEFLGDSVLSAIVASWLYNSYPNEPEGKLSQLKSQIVSAANVSSWARTINLGEYVFLGRSEDSKESRNRDSLLCDVFEAIIGAIYLDGGLKYAEEFVLRFLDEKKEIIITDYKSRLQEFAQSDYKELPKYQVVKEFGPDHEKKFEVGVYLKDKLLGTGAGHSKKEAQQLAAKKAIENIKKTIK